MTPSPLPVIVTNQPGTDWWAQLLDGFLGAVIAAVVAAIVAVLVVRLQHRADRGHSREMAAKQAARSLSQTAFASFRAMTAVIGVYTVGAGDRRRDAVLSWHAALSEVYPDLFGYVTEEEVRPIAVELERHELVVYNGLKELSTHDDVYGQQLLAKSRAELARRERESIEILKVAIPTVTNGFDAFRRYGSEWRKLAPLKGADK